MQVNPLLFQEHNFPCMIIPVDTIHVVYKELSSSGCFETAALHELSGLIYSTYLSLNSSSMDATLDIMYHQRIKARILQKNLRK